MNTDLARKFSKFYGLMKVNLTQNSCLNGSTEIDLTQMGSYLCGCGSINFDLMQKDSSFVHMP